MGFVGSVFGKSGEKAGQYAPENLYRAEYKGLNTGERDYYNQKIQAVQDGNGPSVANQYVANAQNQAVQQANAMAASQRGDVNPAMLARQAQMAAAAGSQNAVQQGALMRTQEALDLTKMYEQLGMQGDMANQNSYNNMQNINAGITNQNNQSKTQFGTSGMEHGTKLLGGIISGGGQSSSAAAASDERLKTNVSSGGSAIDAFLDSLNAHKYEYKDKSFGEGEHVSPMAQELERTPVGDSMVVDTPKGKMVDYGKGFGAILAAQATLNERLKKLETKNG